MFQQPITGLCGAAWEVKPVVDRGPTVRHMLVHVYEGLKCQAYLLFMVRMVDVKTKKPTGFKMLLCELRGGKEWTVERTSKLPELQKGMVLPPKVTLDITGVDELMARGMCGDAAQDLVRGVLTPDPSTRVGGQREWEEWMRRCSQKGRDGGYRF